MGITRDRWPITVILLAFIALGITYGIIDPIFEASDELHHYPLVQRLASGQGLPVQRAEEQHTLWEQEGSQPPLYYAVAALLTGWIDTSDLPTLLTPNPHATTGVPRAPDNKNMVVHREPQPFPWRGSALAVYIIRFFSILLGAGTVFCTYFTALEVFPLRSDLAAGAAALNAFIPMFLFVSASVNNDNLVVFLASLALLLLARIITRGSTRRRLLALGAVLGLACLTKLSALGLLPLTALGLLVHSFLATRSYEGRLRLRDTDLLHWVKSCILVLVPVLLIVCWWYVRNWQLYGDPTGLTAMLSIAGRRDEPVGLAGLLAESQGFRINFWGLFGGVNVLMRPEWVYEALDFFTLLAGAGLLVWVLRSGRRATAATLGVVGLLTVWVTVITLSLIRWTILTPASQGRLVFPAISALCILAAIGLGGWVPPQIGRAVLAVASGTLLLLAASVPFSSIARAYPNASEFWVAGLPGQATATDIHYEAGLRLVGYEVGSTEVSPAGTFLVTLYWEATRPITTDLSISVALLGPDNTVGSHDSYPAGGAAPTSLWPVGQLVRDAHELAIDSGARGPAMLWPVVDVYQFREIKTMSPLYPDGRVAPRPVLGQVHLAVPKATLLPVHRVEANYDGRVMLLGYDLESGSLTAGSDIDLSLYWQAIGSLDRDYVVFLHVVDSSGQVVGGGDSPPMMGFHPTSRWSAGEIVKDTHRVEVSAEAATGRARLSAGFYDLASGERVPTIDAAGIPTGDEAYLGEIIIEPRQ